MRLQNKIDFKSIEKVIFQRKPVEAPNGDYRAPLERGGDPQEVSPVSASRTEPSTATYTHYTKSAVLYANLRFGSTPPHTPAS